MAEDLQRGEDFRQHHLAWIVVRHFLGAAELRELCGEIVSACSNGNLSLKDVVLEHRIPAQDSMGVWAISMRHSEEPLRSYLTRFVQVVAWQGDAEAGLHGNEGEVTDFEIMKSLEFSLRMSREDLVSFNWSDKDISASTAPLRPILESLEGLQAAYQSGELGFQPDLTPFESSSPLRACIVKHLGDLLADVNAWEPASSFYSHALQLLNACNAPHWHHLKSNLEILFNQSAATATAMTGHAERALALMNDAVNSSQGADVLAIRNGADDQRRAKRAIDPADFGYDDRASVVFAPQAVQAPQLIHAMENWAEKRFDDAHRWFWAALRRQIAFGSYLARNETKAYYGLSMFEKIENDLGNRRDAGSFDLALRLLIDSLRYTIVEKTEWSSDFIAKYVDDAVIERAIGSAGSVKAEERQRSNVVVALFKNWLKLLPAERQYEAKIMMSFLSHLSVRFEREFFAERNTGGLALKAFKEASRDRPEFRQIGSAAACTAVISGLRRRHPLDVGEAIELADIYRKDFSVEELRDVTEHILALTEAIPDGQGDWPIVRPVINFLGSSYVARKAKESPLGLRIAKEMLRLTFENKSEQPQAMFVLRYLDPKIVQDHVAQERLADLVGSLKARALQTNSSSSIGAIQALLIAPHFAGSEAVNAALEGLSAVLTIRNPKRPSLIFNEAYYPLIDLARNKNEVIEVLNVTAERLREQLRPLAEKICDVWKAAAGSSVIFSTFSIPQSNEPNPTIVHNWTFASFAFGRAYDFTSEIEEAIAAARQNRDIRKSIDVARVVFAAGKPHDMSLMESIESSPESFYSGLGTWLLAVKSYAGNERKAALRNLIESCFKFGPDGQDIAVLLLAHELGIKMEPNAATRIYHEKLLKNRHLRNSLTPIYRMIVAEEEED
jgi:hypothetical protein